MLPPTPRRRKAPAWRQPPWQANHPDFLRLDARLPPDHLARRIDRLVDTLDLTELHNAYRGFGSDPYPPALLLKVALYQCQRGRHSPALWHCDAHECEPLRWLLRGVEPARSCWYAFRERLDPQLLQQLNAQVSVLARQHGLSAGTRGAQDGTTVAANASRHKLLNLEAVLQRLQLLRQACDADERGVAFVDRPAWMARRRGRARQLARYERAAQRLQERQQDNQRKRACDRQDANKLCLAVADSDAVPGLDKLEVYRPLYNVQLLTDLDSSLILAYDVFAQVNDAGTLGPLLQRAGGQGWRLQVLLADSAYATGPHLALAEHQGPAVFAPWQQSESGKRRGKKPTRLGKDKFVWLEVERVYVCPQGQRLQLERVRKQQRSQGERVSLEIYRCPAEQCRQCPLAAQCTPKPQAGRTISRSEHEPLFEQLRQRMAAAEAKELYRLRKQTVELGFADLKGHRQLRQLSGRGLRRAQVQVGLCVLAHNGLLVEPGVRAETKAQREAG